MKVDLSLFNEEVQIGTDLCKQIESFGYEAYLVGGCVRDCIMKKEPHDFDICTNAKPNEIIKVFKKKQLLLHGMKHIQKEITKFHIV